MDDDARRAVADALVNLARSSAYADRADAGRALANFADVPGANSTLLGLVLDPHDTYVTHATAQALLRRNDDIGIALLAQALARADDDTADWVFTALRDVYDVFPSDRDNAVLLCRELLNSQDADTRAGAEEILTFLSDTLTSTTA